jgi:hypothetical protein
MTTAIFTEDARNYWYNLNLVPVDASFANKPDGHTYISARITAKKFEDDGVAVPFTVTDEESRPGPATTTVKGPVYKSALWVGLFHPEASSLRNRNREKIKNGKVMVDTAPVWLHAHMKEAKSIDYLITNGKSLIFPDLDEKSWFRAVCLVDGKNTKYYALCQRETNTGLCTAITVDREDVFFAPGYRGDDTVTRDQVGRSEWSAIIEQLREKDPEDENSEAEDHATNVNQFSAEMQAEGMSLLRNFMHLDARKLPITELKQMIQSLEEFNRTHQLVDRKAMIMLFDPNIGVGKEEAENVRTEIQVCLSLLRIATLCTSLLLTWKINSKFGPVLM